MGARVVVRKFGSRGDAEIVRELLLANGIEAFVNSDDCGAVDPALSFARGVELLVDGVDRADAEQVLGDDTVAPGQAADDAGAAPSRCAECGRELETEAGDSPLTACYHCGSPLRSA